MLKTSDLNINSFFNYTCKGKYVVTVLNCVPAIRGLTFFSLFIYLLLFRLTPQINIVCDFFPLDDSLS